MIDFNQYKTLKTDGMINKVQKTNTDVPDALTYAVYTKTYELDGSTVKQLPDEVQAVTEVELDARLAELQAEIDAIKAFKADAVNGVVA